MTHLWQFPLEVVKLIVAHIDTHKDLYQWALVSKHFHIIVTPQLWHAPLGNQSLIFGTAYSLLDCLRLGHARQLGYHIRKLKFGRSDVLQYVIQLLGHTPLLEELSLRRLAVRKQDIQWITQHCPRLQLLQLWATYITNDTIGSLGDLCYLRHLELVSCTRLTAQALRPVEHCPLTTLLLHDCTLAIDHHSAIYIQRLTQLTRLELTTPYGGTTRKFMNHLFPPTTIVLPLLQHFFINGSPDDPIDDSVLVPFIKSHPLLTDLTIANCRITQTTLAALKSYLPRLLRLDISSTGGVPLPFQDVRGLIQTCAHLVMLRLNRSDLDPQSFAGLEYSFKWVRAELHAVDLDRIRSA